MSFEYRVAALRIYRAIEQQKNAPDLRRRASIFWAACVDDPCVRKRKKAQASALRTHAGLALRTVRLGAVPDASGDDGTDAALDKLFGTSAVGDESAAVSDESSSSGWDEGFASAEWAGATTKSATTMAQATRSLRAEGDSPSGFSSADAAVAWSPSGTTAESWSAPRWDDSSDESESDTADVPSAAEGMMEVAMTNAFWNVEEQVERGAPELAFGFGKEVL